MRNCFHNYLSISAVISVFVFISGCSSQVSAPKISAIVPITNSSPGIKPNKTYQTSKSNDQSEIDLEQETEIEKQCLAAWRNCLAGKQLESTRQLEALAKKYPKSSSVMFMTGQVLEHTGKRNEAIAYYEKSLYGSDFATMSLFKLAESLRATGKTKKAIIRYRELLAISPDFPQAHIGLAKALMQLDPKSTEAKGEAEAALKLDPNNKEAKALLTH